MPPSFAAKDENTSFNASILAGVILMVFAIFPTLAGMASRGIFGDQITDAEAIPHLISEVLPAGLAAIIVAAIIGAIMSTADSLLVAGTSHITNDIYVKLINPASEKDTKKLLLISRVSTLIVGLLALIMALTFEAIIDLLLYSYTLYAAGVFIPVVMGLYWRRGTAPGAIAGIIGGSVLGVLVDIALIDISGVALLGDFPPIVIGALVSLVLFVMVSMFTEPPRDLPEEVM